MDVYLVSNSNSNKSDLLSVSDTLEMFDEKKIPLIQQQVKQVNCLNLFIRETAKRIFFYGQLYFWLSSLTIRLIVGNAFQNLTFVKNNLFLFPT